MANGRSGTLKAAKAKRVAGLFVALPCAVLDSPAFQALSHPARSLLLEIARQYDRTNNGRLLASANYLKKRGWTSNDTITKAKRELLEARLIYETVMGHRPNKASWYAATWWDLDRLDGYDPGASAAFERGAYMRLGVPKNAMLKPPGGTRANKLAPSGGADERATVPSGGAINGVSTNTPVPPHGDHLEKPSARAVSTAGIQPALQP
jgi:hypothetical protein